MRLLDLVAQCREPLVLKPRANCAPLTVSGPSDYARQIIDCPLRFVIADDLTRASAELAFADGDRLAGCLDLLRAPASKLWVEWSDAIHQQVIFECGSVAARDAEALGRQVGVLLQTATDGRSGLARTFWSVPTPDGGCEAQISPIETHINLDDPLAYDLGVSRMLIGDYGSVTDSRDAGVADLLQRVRYRFDESWRRYYEMAAPGPAAKEQIILKSLATVAHDVPLLLAFFLLLNAKGATRPQPIHRNILNRKRMLRDRAPLLDHVEVHSSLVGSEPTTESGSEGGFAPRHSPRLHHVRGHLVRREDRVFWRMPHLRGNAIHGVVRSRTVCLSFARARN